MTKPLRKATAREPGAKPNSNWARSHKVAVWTLSATIAGVVVAVLVWSPWSSDKPGQGSSTPNVSGTGNVVGSGNALGNGNRLGDVTVGTGGCLIESNGTCVVVKPSTSDQEAAAKSVADGLAKLPGAQTPPAGDGPWPFMVLGTGSDKGEYVRDGSTQADHRIQTADGPALILEFTTMYVDCRIDNGWVADPQAPPRGRWLKVRYPEVATAGDFWMYAGYLVPVDTNGMVPVCSA